MPGFEMHAKTVTSQLNPFVSYHLHFVAAGF